MPEINSAFGATPVQPTPTPVPQAATSTPEAAAASPAPQASPDLGHDENAVHATADGSNDPEAAIARHADNLDDKDEDAFLSLRAGSRQEGSEVTEKAGGSEAPEKKEGEASGLAQLATGVGLGVVAGAVQQLTSTGVELKEFKEADAQFVACIDKFRQDVFHAEGTLLPSDSKALERVGDAAENLTRGLNVVKGVDSAVGLFSDLPSLKHDLETGDGKAAFDHGAKTLKDVLYVTQGAGAVGGLVAKAGEAGGTLGKLANAGGLAEKAGKLDDLMTATVDVTHIGGFQFAGKSVELLGNNVALEATKKVPVLGALASTVDGVARVGDMVHNWDKMSTKDRIANVTGVAADVATDVALVTPPPIDVVAGGLAIGLNVVSLGAEHWDQIQAGAQAAGQAVAGVGNALGGLWSGATGGQTG